jgi:hypothetical protein
MGTIWVKEFTGGLDTRRMPETTPGGVLLEAVNGHISRGGEFEKRAAFIDVADLPAGTVGLGYTTASLFVWGSGALPAGLPSNVRYQQLVHPVTPALKLTKINSFDLYKNKLYVSATFETGETYHYYNGVLVADWVYGAATFAFNVTGGTYVNALYSSSHFDITGGTNAAANKITDIRVGGVKIIQNQLQHTGNDSTTAANIAKEINRYVSTPNYTATSSGHTVTIHASIAGALPNGLAVTLAKTGNVTNTVPTAMAGGANHVASTIDLKVGGNDIMNPIEWRTSNADTAKRVAAEITRFMGPRDFHARWDGSVGVSVIADDPGVWANGLVVTPTYTNGFTTNISGSHNTMAGGKAQPAGDAPWLAGDFVMTIGTKEYALSGPTMYFSMIGDPTKWTDPTVNTGAGFIDMSSWASGSERLSALAKYQTYVAVFSYENIQIWYTDPDPKLNKQSQVLNNTGTRSPHSVCQFGDNDIYYLDESGVRSLRARDSSNSAATADVGVLIDTLVVAKLQTMTPEDRQNVYGLIEPVDGRFWLTMGDLIYVFSYFSGAKVSAWSTYVPSVPGVDVDGSEIDVPFAIEEAVSYRRRIYVRSGDKIYCYSGEDDVPVYDRTEALIQTPYLDGEHPAKTKDFLGFDMACDGVWSVEALMDPVNPDASDMVATVEKSTFPNNRMPMTGRSTHISNRFKTRSAERAKIGSVLIHYTTLADEDDGSR